MEHKVLKTGDYTDLMVVIDYNAIPVTRKRDAKGFRPCLEILSKHRLILVTNWNFEMNSISINVASGNITITDESHYELE